MKTLFLSLVFFFSFFANDPVKFYLNDFPFDPQEGIRVSAKGHMKIELKDASSYSKITQYPVGLTVTLEKIQSDTIVAIEKKFEDYSHLPEFELGEVLENATPGDILRIEFTNTVKKMEYRIFVK